MPALRARTLLEAHLYVTLTASHDDPGPADRPERDFDAHTTLTEGPEEWTVHFDGRALGLPLEIDVLVPYLTEFEARQDRLRFGAGRSELIDAGQWRLLGASYARRALREDLRFAADPTDPERFKAVVLGWEFARDATAEAAKFLPPGAGEVPAEGFWTESGTAMRRQAPERFTRESLESDIAGYQETLDDFIVTHTSRNL
ncbi:hypothetical protein [Sphaerisporangium perillae]|uniref:hypothetical protein n=1 Tax=Sphaerisporangium perillae TaxID=2935860 RepID=UPI00200C4E87|nr:hypothetical protein [Sphaerisporangium perillae]